MKDNMCMKFYNYIVLYSHKKKYQTRKNRTKTFVSIDLQYLYKDIKDDFQLSKRKIQIKKLERS